MRNILSTIIEHVRNCDFFSSNDGPPGESAIVDMSQIRVEKGEPGAKGDTGLSGAKGLQGLNGPAGYPGPKGDLGFPGEMGRRGIPGLDGAPGRDGKSGIPGQKGAYIKGEQGPMGRHGEKGDKGILGSKGERGDTPNCPSLRLDELRGVPGPDGQTGDRGEIMAFNFFSRDDYQTLYFVCVLRLRWTSRRQRRHWSKRSFRIDGYLHFHKNFLSM